MGDRLGIPRALSILFFKILIFWGNKGRRFQLSNKNNRFYKKKMIFFSPKIFWPKKIFGEKKIDFFFEKLIIFIWYLESTPSITPEKM